jgi:predicted ArsR family transcriptional regulator
LKRQNTPQTVAKALEARRAQKRAARPQTPATPRQRAFLEAVLALTEELGRPPSASEVADRLGITRVGARPQLRALAAKGLLSDVPVTVSSGKWALTEAARAALATEDE